MTAVEEDNKEAYEFFVQAMIDAVDTLDNEDGSNIESTIAEIVRFPRQFFGEVLSSTRKLHKF